MNPDTNSPHNFSLPTPVGGGQMPAPVMSGMPQVAPLQPAAGQPAMPMAAQAQPLAQGASQAASDSQDAIDAEWTAKAKQIIAQTAGDPYEQNKQLSYAKAGYLQRRYGKVIKVAE